MKCINLIGAPGSGKSVLAARMFSTLKRHNIKTELVGEFAKELIYLGNEVQLVNQAYIMGCQYRKLKDLQRYGIDVAISDSPLLLQLVYCKNTPYYEEIKPLIYKLNSEFNNMNVYVNRVVPYQNYGRVNTEKESDTIAQEIKNIMGDQFHYIIDGNDEDSEFIINEAMKSFDKDLLAKF